MKAILVVDVQMTEDGKHICDSCPVWNEKICGCKHNFMTGHKGCPLKPLPQEREVNMMKQNEYEVAVNEGWNACLEEITGEGYGKESF